MRLKKAIADSLCSPFIGKFLTRFFNKRIPSLRNWGYRFFVPVQYSSPVIHASIFWGIYESAEIRLIKKCLRSDLPVVELGGSLGIVSSFIIKKLKKENSLKIVEANPNLISTIDANLKRHNINGVQYKIFNNALGYNSNSLRMQLSTDNTASRVIRSETSNNKFVEISCLSLSNLTDGQPYALVCDIEGSEIEIIIHDKEILKQCCQLFIELHDTSYNGVIYKSIELVELLQNIGFICKAKDGNVYFFERDK